MPLTETLSFKMQAKEGCFLKDLNDQFALNHCDTVSLHGSRVVAMLPPLHRARRQK